MEAALRLGNNQSLGRQPRQRFPHGAEADRQVLAQIVDPQPRAGLQPAREQVGTKALVSVMGKTGVDGRGTGHGLL